jgi:hypothetical protein
MNQQPRLYRRHIERHFASIGLPRLRRWAAVQLPSSRTTVPASAVEVLS